MAALAELGIDSVRKILANPKHPQCVRAFEAVTNRAYGKGDQQAAPPGERTVRFVMVDESKRS